MKAKHVVIVAFSLAVAGIGVVLAPSAIPPAYAACDPGTHIDGSTANDARRKMMAAGYSNVRELVKGCDNVWHGIATMNGKPTGVALEPGGKIYPEGN